MLDQGTMPHEEEVSLASEEIHADKKKKIPWTLLTSSAVSSRDVRVTNYSSLASKGSMSFTYKSC